MTFLDSLRPRPVEQRSSLESPLVPLTATAMLDFMSGPSTYTGVAVNEKSSLGMPAVWRAVNLIAGTSASLPLHAYQSKDDVRVKASANALGAKLLDSPHPDMTPYDFWELMYGYLLLWGNAYAQILRNPFGQVTELWPIHPSRVKPGRAADRTKVYVVDGDMDNSRSDYAMLHIPSFSLDGISGLSPIALARQGIGLALAAEEYGAKLYGNGSLMSGILQVDRQLTQEQATRLKSSWKSKAGGGLANAHEVAVLDNGAHFQSMSIAPQDAQFIESRRFQISEVARMFGVPPHMLMDTDRSTSWGSGIEQQGIGFVVYTLRPWLTRVEQRMTRLLNPSTVYAKYAVEGLLRGDTNARYTSYATARQWGWLSINEIRALEDLPPIDGGDEYLSPMNMTATSADAPAPDPAPVDSSAPEETPGMSIVETRTVTVTSAEIRSDKAASELKFSGHAAVFNQRTWIGPKRWGFWEVVDPAFFRNVLNDNAAFLVNHDPNIVLARNPTTMKLSVDERGLVADADWDPNDPDATKWAGRVKRGDVAQMSFAFTVNEERWDENEDTGEETRTLLTAERLYDASLVTYPAYEGTDGGMRDSVAEVVQRHRGFDPRSSSATHTHSRNHPVPTIPSVTISQGLQRVGVLATNGTTTNGTLTVGNPTAHDLTVRTPEHLPLDPDPTPVNPLPPAEGSPDVVPVEPIVEPVRVAEEPALEQQPGLQQRQSRHHRGVALSQGLPL